MTSTSCSPSHFGADTHPWVDSDLLQKGYPTRTTRGLRATCLIYKFWEPTFFPKKTTCTKRFSASCTPPLIHVNSDISVTKIKKNDVVQVRRSISEHGLRQGDRGTVVRCHYGLDLYDVQFANGSDTSPREVAIDGEDLDVYVEGDHTEADQERKATEEFVMDQLQKVFEDINKYKVKEGVDRMGLNGFVKHCARLSAVTGAATGAFGPMSIIGLPIDIANVIVQQFRVTLAVMYDQTGEYRPAFEPFMKIVALSVGANVGVHISKEALKQISKQILARLAVGGAGRMVPFVGGAVVGAVNYSYIKAIAATLKKIDIDGEA